MTRLEELLHKYRDRPISPRLVEDLLRQSRFTGEITTHWRDGIPLKIEAGRPITVPLQGALPVSEQEPLDKVG